MRDDASLHRLAEMGVDVYLPRSALRQGVAAPAAPTAPVQSAPVAAPVDAVLFADASSPAARALIADVVRSLKFARVACAPDGADAEAVLAHAAAVIMLGAAQARRAGALVPAPRQREIAWVVADEPAALRGNVQARRALWSELKRIARGLARHGDPARR